MPSRNVEARPIKWRITQDKRVNSLGDPWAMLAYTWMIPCADNLGRMEGDPDLVASMIFPRQRAEITPERMAEILQALHDAGLIFWYEVDGERFIQFPPESWERHQKLVGNMTRTSDFPEPPAEAYQAWYEHVRTRSNGVQTRSPEGKGREGKDTASPNGDGQARKRAARQPAFTDDEKRPVEHLKAVLQERGVNSFPRDWHLKGYAVSRQMQRQGATADDLIACIDWMASDPYWSQRIDSMHGVRAAWPQFRLRRTRASPRYDPDDPAHRILV